MRRRRPYTLADLLLERPRAIASFCCSVLRALREVIRWGNQ